MHLAPYRSLTIFHLVYFWCNLFLACFVSIFFEVYQFIFSSHTFLVHNPPLCLLNLFPDAVPFLGKRFQYVLCLVDFLWFSFNSLISFLNSAICCFEIPKLPLIMLNKLFCCLSSAPVVIFATSIGNYSSVQTEGGFLRHLLEHFLNSHLFERCLNKIILIK